MKLVKITTIGLLGLTLAACNGAEKDKMDSAAADSGANATVATASEPTESGKSLSLTSDTDKASYGMGLNLGRNLKQQEIEINVAAMTAGIDDGMAGTQQVTDADIQAAVAKIREAFMKKAHAKTEAQTAKNKTFLDENAKRDGIKVTESGLQYEVLKSGDDSGESPKATDTVSVHYHGTLVDGSVFDSSVERGQPAEFPVNGVISGWTEALQLMKVGDKWKLYLPPEIAYGARSPSPKIPPNSVLIFEVELLDIKKS